MLVIIHGYSTRSPIIKTKISRHGNDAVDGRWSVAPATSGDQSCIRGQVRLVTRKTCLSRWEVPNELKNTGWWGVEFGRRDIIYVEVKIKVEVEDWKLHLSRVAEIWLTRLIQMNTYVRMTIWMVLSNDIFIAWRINSNLCILYYYPSNFNLINWIWIRQKIYYRLINFSLLMGML